MTDAVFDFPSIKRKLNRMEQKADFDAKNPEPAPSMYGWPYGVAVPLVGGAGGAPSHVSVNNRIYRWMSVGCGEPEDSLPSK